MKTLARKTFYALGRQVIYELSSCHFCKVQAMVKSSQFLRTNITSSLGNTCVHSSCGKLCVYFISRWGHHSKNTIYCFGDIGVNSHSVWQLFWLFAVPAKWWTERALNLADFKDDIFGLRHSARIIYTPLSSENINTQSDCRVSILHFSNYYYGSPKTCFTCSLD